MRENIILALQAGRGWTRPIPRRRQDELVAKWIKALDIRPADPNQVVGTLSGGNQQKVLLARWLLTEPRLVILDEPTRGIDVGAKTEIQRLVRSLCDDGMSVLFISAELEEVLRLSHRVAVLRDRQRGRGARERRTTSTVERLVHTIAGTERAHERGTRRLALAAGSRSACSCWSTSSSATRFFTLRMQDGHLYGSLIDILRFGAPAMLVALGHDARDRDRRHRPLRRARSSRSPARPSCLLISHLDDQTSVGGVLVAIAAALALSRGARPLERRPRRHRRHPADRRDADPDGRRARDRAADHVGPDHHDQQLARTSCSATATGSRCRSRSSWSPAMYARQRPAQPQDRARDADRVGRRERRGEPPRRRPLAEPDHPRVYVFSRLCSGIAGLMISSGDQGRRRQQRRPLVRARRDPRRRDRRHRARRRALLPRRHARRRAADPDADDDDLLDRHPAGDDAALQGARRHVVCLSSRPPSGAKVVPAPPATAQPPDSHPARARPEQPARHRHDHRRRGSSAGGRRLATGPPPRSTSRCSSRSASVVAMFAFGSVRYPDFGTGRCSSTCSSTTRSCSCVASG